MYCIDEPEGKNTLYMTEPRGITVIKCVGTQWVLSGSVES